MPDHKEAISFTHRHTHTVEAGRMLFSPAEQNLLLLWDTVKPPPPHPTLASQLCDKTLQTSTELPPTQTWSPLRKKWRGQLRRAENMQHSYIFTYICVFLKNVRGNSTTMYSNYISYGYQNANSYYLICLFLMSIFFFFLYLIQSMYWSIGCWGGGGSSRAQWGK